VVTTHGHEEPFLQQGEACAATWLHDNSRETGISSAEDLGGGFVAQVMFEHGLCGGRSLLVVQDCRTGEALAFGGYSDNEAPSQWSLVEALRGEVETGIAAGNPMTVAEIEGDAQGRGFETVVALTTTSRVAVGGEHEVRLGCGCDLYYPGLPGGGG
jgi:hypothetical protein